MLIVRPLSSAKEGGIGKSLQEGEDGKNVCKSVNRQGRMVKMCAKV